jgi:hypothetical protein
VPVTYTNRQGRTYYLCQGLTKTGKPRYYFARELKGEPMEQVPEGYEIRENVNGLVFLAKVRPVQILPGEVTAVEAAVQRHPKAHNYRIDVRDNRIEVYERVGADLEELVPALQRMGAPIGGRTEELRRVLEQGARFSPVLRFILVDEGKRTFRAERWCYLGSIDDWIDVGPTGRVHRLARKLIPRLGTDAFFGLH